MDYTSTTRLGLSYIISSRFTGDNSWILVGYNTSYKEVLAHNQNRQSYYFIPSTLARGSIAGQHDLANACSRSRG